MVTITIPFVQVAASENPNLQNASDEESLRTYLDAAIIAFASVSRWNPTFQLQFTTNAPVPDWFEARLISLNARLSIVPFDHRPPEGFARAFLGSFFLFDAMSSASSDDFEIFIDPDVVCVDDMADVIDRCAENVGVISISYDAHKEVNGLSGLEASEIFARMHEPRDGVRHFGGEFYCVPKQFRNDLNQRISVGWESALDSFTRGNSYLTTEEHVLNFAIGGMPHVMLNDRVKRVWTAHAHRTVDGNEAGLALWHLPAEKERGFKRLGVAVSDTNSWFWTSSRETFVKRMSRNFGLTGRGPVRLIKDAAGRSYRSLRELLAEKK